MISDAGNSISVVKEGLRKCPSRDELLASSIADLEDGKSKLRLAKGKIALKDYRASLEAIPIAEQTYILANRAKKEAVEKIAYYKNERSKRLRRAILDPLWAIPLIMIAGAFLGSLGGCAIGVFSRSVSTSGGAKACAILGAIGGLFLGIVWTILDFLDVNDVK